MSMSDYALDLSKQTRYLTSPITEREIIRSVKRHFGSSITREIRPTTVKNLKEFIVLLDEIEYEQKQARKASKESDDAKNKSCVENNKPSARVVKNYARKETPTALKKFGSDYRRDNDSIASGKKSAEYIKKANFYRDIAYANANKNVQKYANKETNNFKKRLKLEEIPISVNKAKTRELIPYKQNANNKASKIKTDKNFQLRKNVTAIDNNGEKLRDEESEIQENDREIVIVRTRELLRDVDEVFEEDQNRLHKKATPYVKVTIGALTVRTLINTGSQISLITKTIYDKIVERRCE